MGRVSQPVTNVERPGTGFSRRALGRMAAGALVLARGAQASVCAPAPDVADWQPLAVGPGVWRFAAARGRTNADNGGRVTQLVLVGDESRLWLIGSGPSPADGRRLRCTIERELGRAVTDVVNTRAHPELALGNVAFDGARLWALPDVAAAMRKRCASCVDALKTQLGAGAAPLDGGDVRAPTHAIGHHGDRIGRLGPFTWAAWPRAPGDRAMVLWLQSRRLVIAQGWVWAGALPDLRETRLGEMQAGLSRLEVLVRDHHLLGEQGDIADRHEVAHHRAYLGALRRQVEAALRRGGDVESVLAHPFAHDYLRIREDAVQHTLNVQRAWLDLEEGWFRRR